MLLNLRRGKHETFEVFDSFLVFNARTDFYTVLTSQIVGQSSKTFGSAILCRQTHPATSLLSKFSLWICNAAEGPGHSRGPREGSTSAITFSLLLMILQTQQEYLPNIRIQNTPSSALKKKF
jgi:hypothetical protein